MRAGGARWRAGPDRDPLRASRAPWAGAVTPGRSQAASADAPIALASIGAWTLLSGMNAISGFRMATAVGGGRAIPMVAVAVAIVGVCLGRLDLRLRRHASNAEANALMAEAVLRAAMQLHPVPIVEYVGAYAGLLLVGGFVPEITLMPAAVCGGAVACVMAILILAALLHAAHLLLSWLRVRLRKPAR